MLRVEGRWQEAGWERALEAAAALLRDAVKEGGPERLGFLCAPGSTNEEAYLLGRLARGLGSHNVDSRLRQRDFSDQASDPAFHGLGMALREVDSLGALLLAGCHVRDEAPILAHRVRKAALAGCKVSLLSTRAQQCHFPVLRQAVVDPAGLAAELAALAAGDGLDAAQKAVVESLSVGPQRDRARRRRDAAHAFRGHPRRGGDARREDRRDARVPAGRRQCRGHGARGRAAAPAAGRTAGRGAGTRRRAHARVAARRLRAPGRHRARAGHRRRPAPRRRSRPAAA